MDKADKSQRPLPPLAVGALAAGAVLFPHSTLYAEAPPEDHVRIITVYHAARLTDSVSQLSRKPIYDDLALIRQPPKATPAPSKDSSTKSPTPTDRLAGQISHARRFFFAHTIAAEDRLNAFMSSVLHQERAFTETIASLAPPPESHERIMPGALYVLVAAMTGSIISRNRNILLRASVPFAVGLGAAWIVMPLTMRNVGDLVWTCEEKVPVIMENHMRIRGAVEEGWRQTKMRGEITKKWSDERVKGNREAIEGWVRKGK